MGRPFLFGAAVARRWSLAVGLRAAAEENRSHSGCCATLFDESGCCDDVHRSFASIQCVQSVSLLLGSVHGREDFRSCYRIAGSGVIEWQVDSDDWVNVKELRVRSIHLPAALGVTTLSPGT